MKKQDIALYVGIGIVVLVALGTFILPFCIRIAKDMWEVALA